MSRVASGIRRHWAWAGWIMLTLAAGAGMARWMRQGEDRRAFLPGETTHGHYQIEMRCDVCHRPSGSSPGPGTVRREACVRCHGEELRRARDSHPEKKFTDPRNADLLSRLDARECAACHVEHRPQWTGAMGVTLPMDYCVHCHAGIGEERPSHKGMGFQTCAAAGCHNFHDNTALYEDFLGAHLDDPARFSASSVPTRPRPPERGSPGRALTASDADAPPEAAADRAVVGEWERDVHAARGVNCSGCHGAAWNPRPAWRSCRECHEAETWTFLEGRHGMRLAQDLPPMRPEWARLPMRAEAAHRDLTCTACHGAHGFDVRAAAAQSCLQCHDDGHSRAYLRSPHYRAWLRELDGSAPAGSGVSCATCHMPRQFHPEDSAAYTHADHNQNENLRPNEKMLRSACLRCHGLGFSMDALADARAVAENFPGPPDAHVASLDMVRARMREFSGTRSGVPETRETPPQHPSP